MNIKFFKSNRKNKKYLAVILFNGKLKMEHFGDRRYEQFKDSTGLGLYSHLDHGDLKRRKNYFLRHSGVPTKKEAMLKEKPGTAKWLSHKYLW